MKNKIKYLLLIPIDILIITISIIYFKITGRNNKFTIQSFIRLFCVSGGFSNDIVSLLTRKKIAKFNNKKISSDVNFSIINNNLKNEGFFLYENFMSQKECDDLRNYILQTELIPKSDLNPNNQKEIKFNQNNPMGTIYEMEKNKILKNKIAQEILFNDTIFQISQNYFESVPLFDHISLAVSTKSKKPDYTAAQMFHFDLDKPKWLKFFIFLNDVDESNGPHFFVPKSHKNLGITKEIRYRGYDRIDDNIILKNYNDIKVMTAKKGTLLIEDTRGLHKGSVVKENYRCIAMIQYNNSNFVSDVVRYNLEIYEDKNNKFYKNNLSSYANLEINK